VGRRKRWNELKRWRRTTETHTVDFFNQTRRSGQKIRRSEWRERFVVHRCAEKGWCCFASVFLLSVGWCVVVCLLVSACLFGCKERYFARRVVRSLSQD
jgi:hypothetical protein